MKAAVAVIAAVLVLRVLVYAEAEANYTRPPWSWLPLSS